MYEINLEELKKKEIKKFNRIYLKEKKDYLFFLNKLILNENKFAGFSTFFYRHDNTCSTFLNYCRLILIKQIINKESKIIIKTKNYLLYKLISKNFKQARIKIGFTGKKINTIFFYLRPIFLVKKIFFIIFYSISEIISSSKNIDEVANKKEIILIDTNLIEKSFKNKKFIELFYGNAKKYFKNKKVLFTEENLLLFKSRKFREIIRRKKNNFLFKSDYLKITDYIWALVKVTFPNYNLNKRKLYKYKKIILDLSFKNDLQVSFCNINYYIGLLNYRFFLRLKENKIRINTIVNWNENQSADKGFSLGVKTFYNKSNFKGYSPIFINYFFHPERQPLPAEIKKKYFPNSYYVPHKKMFSHINAYAPEVKLYECPIFRSNEVLSNRIAPLKSIKNILISLPLDKTEAFYTIKQILKADFTDHKVTINFHPAFNSAYIKKISEITKKKFIISNDNFLNLIKKNDCVISLSSSVALESILLGKKLISPISSNFLNDSPSSMIFGNKYENIAYNSEDYKLILSKMKRYTDSDIKYFKLMKKKLIITKEKILNFID